MRLRRYSAMLPHRAQLGWSSGTYINNDLEPQSDHVQLDPSSLSLVTANGLRSACKEL